MSCSKDGPLELSTAGSIGIHGIPCLRSTNHTKTKKIQPAAQCTKKKCNCTLASHPHHENATSIPSFEVCRFVECAPTCGLVSFISSGRIAGPRQQLMLQERYSDRRTVNYRWMAVICFCVLLRSHGGHSCDFLRIVVCKTGVGLRLTPLSVFNTASTICTPGCIAWHHAPAVYGTVLRPPVPPVRNFFLQIYKASRFISRNL